MGGKAKFTFSWGRSCAEWHPETSFGTITVLDATRKNRDGRS